VQQAGLFRIKGMPDDQRTRMLATFCPNLLFPYAREAIDGMMVRGALPPLYLAPVNFDALFEEALKRRAAQQAEAAPGTSKGSTQH